MNQKKIAFISCVNDEQEFAEAQYYIRRLIVPDGYETDVISVQEAPGMAAGYNAAMQASDAKYKIYLHQDVFIINRNFITDMLQTFQNDWQIGMFGCIGCENLPLHAQAVSVWDVGNVYHNCIPAMMKRRQNEDQTPIVVEALDGLLLATQYDIPWREDLFDGWDFYDISQCFEMHRQGYKVAVPYQGSPWCYHDNTYSKMVKYEEYCKRFVREYQDIKPFQTVEYRESRREFERLREESRRQLKKLVDTGNKMGLQEIFLDGENRGYLHLREFEVLADIDRREREAGDVRFWEAGDDYKILMTKLAVLRFGLKRIEYHADEEDILREIKNNYSMQAIDAVSDAYVVKEQGGKEE